MKINRITGCALMLLFGPFSVVAQDVEGAADHPKLPRIEGTRIVAYGFSDYDEAVFISGLKPGESNRETMIVDDRKEGIRTRIIYETPATLSTLGIMRNYQKALADLGSVEEIFSCRNETCPENLGEVFVWRESERLPTPYEDDRRFYHVDKGIAGPWYGNQSYTYSSVSAGGAQYYVSVYTAERFEARPWNGTNWPAAGQNLVHVEIIESDSWEPALEFVEAEEISSQIIESGRIALYGIQFDTDSTKLKTESSGSLDEIAKALEASPGLNLYVVGHTDNQGAFEYNRDLSERRAQVVVNRLVSMYGVDESRLIPHGVGPLAPVASNESDQGRALNRRVELVRQ